MQKSIRKIICLMCITAMIFVTACSSVNEGKLSSAEEDVVVSSISADSTQQIDSDKGSEEIETADNLNEESQDRYVVEWAKDSVIYEVNIRQYTEAGTFAAFSDHLQRLKDMGVTTLWFMPIYPISEINRSGVLGSYYSIADYREVNSEFGSKEDFKALVDEAHDMGFTVMLDWVANHTGWDNAWITEHPDWYQQDKNGEIISPPNMGWPDVAQLNFENKDLRAEMIDCMKYWVENFDVDGFRCDYATGVPQDFWEEARVGISKDKELLMLAEDNIVLGFLNSAFDANYNWNLYETMKAIAKGTKSASVIKHYIPSNYPDGTFSMNFLDNHDKNSYNGTIVENFGEEALPQMLSILFTVPGVPLIYSGDEMGLSKSLSFTSKDSIDWGDEYLYADLLKTLSQIRSDNPALYSGNWGGDITYLDNGNKYIFTFQREKDGNVITCIFNMSKKEKTDFDLTEALVGMNSVLIHGQGKETLILDAYDISEDKMAERTSLDPWEFWILSSEAVE